MFAKFLFQVNKMEFYAAWELADQQKEDERAAKATSTRTNRLPAPLVAKSDPYQVDDLEIEEESYEFDSSTSLEDEVTKNEKEKAWYQEVSAKKDKEEESSSDSSDTEESEADPAQPSKGTSTANSVVTVNIKDVKEENAEEEKKDLKRATCEDVKERLTKRMKDMQQSLDDGDITLESLVACLKANEKKDDPIQGATTKWIPPPEQAPQPQTQASQPATVKASTQLPVKARPPLIQTAPANAREPPKAKARPTSPARAPKAPQQATAIAPEQAPQQAPCPPWLEPQPSPPPPQNMVAPIAASPPPPPPIAKAPVAERVRGYGGPQYAGHLYVPLLYLLFFLIARLKCLNQPCIHPVNVVTLS